MIGYRYFETKVLEAGFVSRMKKYSRTSKPDQAGTLHIVGGQRIIDFKSCPRKQESRGYRRRPSPLRERERGRVSLGTQPVTSAVVAILQLRTPK